MWLDDLKKEALGSGISEETLDAALVDLSPVKKIIESDRSQPELRQTLNDYLASRINRSRIETGRRLLRENWRLFAELSRNYPVQSRVLIALWGIETDFGRNQGTVAIVPALVTLAYDARRSDYFRRELLNALRIVDKKLIPLDHMQGSWAGAMGQVQFMPSVYLQYALDFDRDGKIDIRHSTADALGSAANYLTRLGWTKNWNWGREVYVPKDFDPDLNGLDRRLRISDWHKLGIRRIGGSDLPKAEGRAALIRPDGPAGRSFLVYENYDKLLRWNRSHKFAISVGLLADEIGKP
ncbi:MAG: lytic murein transglycosylase [Desulfuromonadales bacterium]|nr:lytic murein transglycosylase [Desulfuromonadales bacterium]